MQIVYVLYLSYARIVLRKCAFNLFTQLRYTTMLLFMDIMLCVGNKLCLFTVWWL